MTKDELKQQFDEYIGNVNDSEVMKDICGVKEEQIAYEKSLAKLQELNKELDARQAEYEQSTARLKELNETIEAKQAEYQQNIESWKGAK